METKEETMKKRRKQQGTRRKVSYVSIRAFGCGVFYGTEGYKMCRECHENILLCGEKHRKYTSGSHGCINLPLDMAAAIYGYVSKGFPVVCYY